jgi:tetratricopeptide (TPR) repeat protein
VKAFRVFGAFLFPAVVIVALNSHTQAAETETAPAPAAVPLATVGPELGSTLSGNFLAGRFAQRQQDWESAQGYMNAVMSFDGDNALLQQRTFLLTIGARQYDRAKALAEKISARPDGSELAAIYLACDALAKEDFKAAQKHIARLPEDGFGQYTKPLLNAWSLVGLGKKKEALKLLRENADQDDPTFNVHAGLMAELAGDKKLAAKHYTVAMKNGLTLHTAVLVANFFMQEGQKETAETIYSSLGRLFPFNPFAGEQGLKTRPNITRAADGAAIALYDLATLLYERRAYDSAQIYGSMVLLLSPSSPFGMMMMGDIAALNERHDKAIEEYNAVADTSPLYWLSRMRVAEVYEAGNRMPDAVAMLEKLSHDKTTRLQALVSLGDMYRRHEDYASALKAYDEAITSVPKITEEHWPIVYARGMSLERLKNWDRAEKDLLQALAFQPDNPMILNFIGYSWADKGLHLDQALDFIGRAVAQRPDDGYIVDSYGWALFKTGKYDQSIEWLEKAVGIIPDDPTILDHLADAYWQSGRAAEARFKWRRAHELSKDNSFRAALNQKILKGPEAPTPVVAQKDTHL